jgi:hypothetical protein
MIRRVQLGLLSVAAISFITAVVLAISARDAMAAPNLVTNGDFATVITGWTDQPDTTSTWAPGPVNDADGNSNSGSIQVVYDHVDTNGQGIAQSDCITLTGDGNYELQGDSRLSSGNAALTNAYIRVQLHTDGTCTAPDILTGIFDTNQNFSNDDTWTASPLINSTVVVSGHLSAQVMLIVEADDFDNEIGNFDNVALSNGPLDPTPTNTATPTETPTETPTPLPTDTPTPLPTDTPTPLPTDTPVPTDTPTETSTPLPTDTPTETSTPLPTNTPGGPTDTPTNTPTATNTPVPTATNTPVPPTATNTPAGVPTNTPAATNTPMATATSGTPTNTPQATNTAAATETATAEPTSTEVPEATEETGLPPASEIEQPTNDGGAGGAGGDPSAAGELPETGTGSQAVEDLTMPLVLAGVMALIGAMALAGVENHRIRQ